MENALDDVVVDEPLAHGLFLIGAVGPVSPTSRRLLSTSASVNSICSSASNIRLGCSIVIDNALRGIERSELGNSDVVTKVISSKQGRNTAEISSGPFR